MRTILLYGFLGKRFGRVHHYDVQNPAEAVRAMGVTIEGFTQAVIDGGSYRVLIAGKQALTVQETRNPSSFKETIRIVPVIAGASGGGVFQAILGIALVVVGFVVAAAGFPAQGAFIAKAGIMLFIGGVSQMLFAPKPAGDPADKMENKPSYSFNGAINTVAQGNPVSILYGGPLIIGSQVISAGLSVEQI